MKLTIINILKTSIQWHLVQSQCCAAIISIIVITPKKTPYPLSSLSISPCPLSPGRAAPTFTCVHCCWIISPVSGEQAAFSLALVYKYLRGQIARREDYLVWYEEENGMERGNGNFRVRLHCVKFWKALWMGVGRSTLEYNDIKLCV